MQQQEINLFIAHIHFRLDREQNRLYEVNRPENTISIDALKDEGDFYTCLYNRSTANVQPDMVKADDVPGDLIRVVIPADALDGATGNYQAYNTESYKNDWHIFLADEHVMNRLQGHLPKIDIDSENYFVDWKLKELRHTENPHLRIGIPSLEPVDDGTVYRGLYNTDTRRLTERLTGNENPDHLSFLDIPYELKLDPVAVAREYGLKDTELLPRFPIEKDLKAKIVKLGKEQKAFIKAFLASQKRKQKFNKQIKGGRGL